MKIVILSFLKYDRCIYARKIEKDIDLYITNLNNLYTMEPIYYYMKRIKKNNNDHYNFLLNDNKSNKPLIIVKDSNLQLSSTSQSLSTNITITKDERLDLIKISKGLIQILKRNGFTVEMILEYGPSQIAEILGIDVYIGKIIYEETKKATRNINTNSLIN